MEVKCPRSDDELAKYFRLRWQVLRAPFGSPPGSERDDLDDQPGSCTHAMILDDAGQPLAAGRLHFNSPREAQIRYMAVAEHARGQGLGRQIVEHLESIARIGGGAAVVLNARDEVVGFYASMGYEVVGPGPTMFGTVTHSKMQKPL